MATFHEWFGLSYASYLTIPRIALQHMPDEWQQKMVAMLEELDDMFGDYYGQNGYEVTLVVDGKPQFDPLNNYRRGRLVPKSQQQATEGVQ